MTMGMPLSLGVLMHLALLAGENQPAEQPTVSISIRPVQFQTVGDESGEATRTAKLPKQLKGLNLDAVEELEQLLDSASSTASEPASPEAVSTPELTSEMAALRDKIRQALDWYATRPVNTRDHSPWEVMHWVIAYNVNAQIRTQGSGTKTDNAVGWLCWNKPCQYLELLDVQNGRITGRVGPGVQGHEGQFLAILAQSKVKADYPMLVRGKKFTVRDLIESEKLTCQPGTELTFKLISLAHYLDLNETWKNQQGLQWSIPRLIHEELEKPIHGAACGGTHRLMGLSYAIRMRQKRGQPVDGEYRRAQAFINDYHRYTLGLQNPDGSFSTAWFVGREARQDVDRRVQTTGHILEWLVFSLHEEDLQDPRIVRATNYLVTALLREPNRDWKIGPLGHALRSLTLYNRRVFEPLDPRPVPVIAGREVPETGDAPPVSPEPVTNDPSAGNSPAAGETDLQLLEP